MHLYCCYRVIILEQRNNFGGIFMLKKNKIFILGLLILLVSVILINPLFAAPKTARPWDSSSTQDDDIWSYFGVYDKITKEEISTFLDDYADFVNDAKKAYNDKDVTTLRRLKRESLNYEDKFFTYKKSDNWTSKDTTTFVTQTKNLEKYLLNRFYEKTSSSGKGKGKTPPTRR